MSAVHYWISGGDLDHSWNVFILEHLPVALFSGLNAPGVHANQTNATIQGETHLESAISSRRLGADFFWWFPKCRCPFIWGLLREVVSTYFYLLLVTSLILTTKYLAP